MSVNNPKPMNIFGPSWDNYIDEIWADWDKKVSDGDIVIIGGDISWAMRLEDALADLAEIRKNKGRIILIRGNHDYWWASIGKVRAALPADMWALQNDAVKFSCKSPADIKYKQESGGLVNANYMLVNSCNCRKTQNEAIECGKSAVKFNDVIICGTRGWNLPESRGQKAEDKKILDREVMRLEMSLKQAKILQEQADEKKNNVTNAVREQINKQTDNEINAAQSDKKTAITETVQKSTKIICVIHYPPFNSRREGSPFTDLIEKYGVSAVVYGHIHYPQPKERMQPVIEKNGIKYYLTSCDLVHNKLTEIAY